MKLSPNRVGCDCQEKLGVGDEVGGGSIKQWKKHSLIIAVTLGISQIVIGLAPSSLLFQLVILTLSSNIIALVYAVYAYRVFEDTTEKLKPVFTSRLIQIVDASYGAMSPKRRGLFEHNLEQLAALAMVYVDRIGEMGEEQFGEMIGRTLGMRLRVTPEDLRNKINMVSGV